MENMPDNAPELEVKQVSVDHILPPTCRVRTVFDEEGIKSLARSIDKEGLEQPILIYSVPAPSPVPEGVSPEGEWFELVAGERRWRAFKLLGRKTIPAIIIKPADKNEIIRKALVENMQRENLDPVDEAMGFKQLAESGPQYWTHEHIGEEFGRDQSYVSLSIKMLELPEAVLGFIRRRMMTRSHAIELLGLTVNQRQKAAETIISKDLSILETRKLVKSLLADPGLSAEKAGLSAEEAAGKAAKPKLKSAGTGVQFREVKVRAAG